MSHSCNSGDGIPRPQLPSYFVVKDSALGPCEMAIDSAPWTYFLPAEPGKSHLISVNLNAHLPAEAIALHPLPGAGLLQDCVCTPWSPEIFI